MTNANEDKIRALAELKRIDDLLKNTKSAIGSLVEERNGSAEKVNILKEKSAYAAKEIAKIDAQKSLIQSEIDEMTGGRDNISQKREKLTSDITDIKLQIIENQKDAAALIVSADDLESSISNRAARSAEIDSEIAAVIFKIEQLKADILSNTDNIDNIKQRIENYGADIANLMNERNNIEKAGVQLRSSERERTLERERTSYRTQRGYVKRV